jgi:uncharacterized protein YyaL (SSP411 family)
MMVKQFKGYIAAVLMMMCTNVLAADHIEWHDWAEANFDQARLEHRLILLDLYADWCGWCHKMDKETYTDPDVIHMINTHFIPVRVDKDARPDVVEKYHPEGWPATVILDANKKTVAGITGYLNAHKMMVVLKKYRED